MTEKDVERMDNETMDVWETLKDLSELAIDEWFGLPVRSKFRLMEILSNLDKVMDTIKQYQFRAGYRPPAEKEEVK